MTDPHSAPPEGSGNYRAVTDGDLRDAMELREFLTGLGVVMQLPTKRPTAVNEVVKPPRTKTRRPWLVPAALLGCIATFALAVPAVMPTRNDPLPPTLLGRWRTQTPKYADRGFEISNVALHMKRGQRATDIAVFPIRRVRVSPRGNHIAIAIDYEEDGVTQSLDLTMLGSGRGTFVEVRNQPDVIWRRER